MRIALVLSALAIAGCASQSPEQLQARVGNASNYQLCRAILTAPQNVAQIAQGEANRRGLDCAPLAGAILQNEAQADAARAALAQQLLARPIYQPTPYQMQVPQPINCNSYRLGNTVQTNCN